MAGLVLGDVEVGGGLAVVAALEVGELQGGAQGCGHGLHDVVGAGGDRGVADLALQVLGGAVALLGQRGGLGGAQPLHGEAVGQGGDPGAQGALLGVVGVGVFPDVGEDLAGDAVGGAFVAEDAVGEAVHEGGETVVELAEGGRLTACEPLLHLAVPAGRCVLLRHAAPSACPCPGMCPCQACAHRLLECSRHLGPCTPLCSIARPPGATRW